MACSSKWMETRWCSSRRSRRRMRAFTPARHPFITTQQWSLSRWTSWARTGCSVRTRCFLLDLYGAKDGIYRHSDATFIWPSWFLICTCNSCSPAELWHFFHQCGFCVSALWTLVCIGSASVIVIVAIVTCWACWWVEWFNLMYPRSYEKNRMHGSLTHLTAHKQETMSLNQTGVRATIVPAYRS